MLKTTAIAMLNPHNELRQIDQSMITSISVGLAMVGAMIGRVFRPTIRSPSASLKSCAWIVVAIMPALTNIDVRPILSRA